MLTPALKMKLKSFESGGTPFFYPGQLSSKFTGVRRRYVASITTTNIIIVVVVVIIIIIIIMMKEIYKGPSPRLKALNEHNTQ